MSNIIGLNRHPREQFNDELAKLVSWGLKNAGGWQVVANDLGRVAGGLVAAFSDKPQRDLNAIAAAIRHINWRLEKRRIMAAKLGVDPSQIDEKDLGAEDDVEGRDSGSDGGSADPGAVPSGDGPVEPVGSPAEPEATPGCSVP